MKHLYNTHNTAMDWIGRAPIMDDVWTQIDQELNPRIHTHTHRNFPTRYRGQQPYVI